MMNVLIIVVIVVCILALIGTLLVTRMLDDNYERKKSFSSLSLFSLVMIYGYFCMKKWGFWTMITYSAVFGVISSLLISNPFDQLYIGNMIFSMVVLVYTIYVKKAFFNEENLQY